MCDVIAHAAYVRVCVREAFLKGQNVKQNAKFGKSKLSYAQRCVSHQLENSQDQVTAILRRSQFNCPGKRKPQVMPLIAADTKWFKSP